MRLSIAFVLAAALAACSGPPKKDPYAPRPDDVATVLTCCVTAQADGPAKYETVAEDKCPEENRNPLDTCDIGPGDLPRD
jgi:hypothetical protein